MGRERAGHGLRDRLALVRQLLRRPREVAYLTPSSRHLERRLVRVARVADARIVVELGPGTGGTSAALLDALPPDATLFCIEVDPVFAARLGALRDPRLRVHCGPAEELEEALDRHRLPRADAVVSGIPFSHLSREAGRAEAPRGHRGRRLRAPPPDGLRPAGCHRGTVEAEVAVGGQGASKWPPAAQSQGATRRRPLPALIPGESRA